MHHISFGNVLKEARLAKGLDLAAVSRELRIRQDIIVAIENSDFARMPSRGYTRNMVIAYARLVGLNPQDISRMYLDQEYAYQVEQAHRSVGDTIQMHNEPYRRGTGGSSTGRTERISRAGGQSDRTSRNRAYDDEPARVGQRGIYDGSSNGFGRRVYSQNAVEPPYAPRNNASVAHRARRSAMTDGRYTNLYTAPKNIPNPNRKRNIIIGAVIVLLLVIILIVVTILSNRSEPQTNIPVTGVDVTAQQSQQGDQQNQQQTAAQQTTTEQPPEQLTLRYEVADGSESYIEVYVDDKVQESSTVSGPASQTYTSTGKIRFVATETKGVKLYINDEEVELKTNDSGIVNTTYTFEDILNQWYDEHPNVTRSDTASSNSTKNATSQDGGSTNNASSSSSSTRSSSSSSSDESSE